MIGRTLSHYRVLEILGQGGMGTVYLGEDTRLNRRVAIKVISGAAHTNPASVTRFLQEARTASALDHPNICAIHQIDETEEGTPFLVMAHYAGETLDKRLLRGPMRLGEAVGLAAQVAEGLAHAHARGVVHRDIKPSNVLVTPEGVVKILDFGLAKLAGAESMTATGVSIGTPSYMSPEQVRAESVDARSDVWSCGVLLYSLLAGRSPFDGENLAQVTYAILEGDPVPIATLLPGVPPEFQRILDRCLAKRADDRYADARTLAADLRKLETELSERHAQMLGLLATSGERTIATPSAPRRGGAGPGSRRWPWVAGGALLVLALGTAGVVAWQRAHPPEPLRVAVLMPEVTGEPDSLAAAEAATNATAALLRGLAAFRGLAPLDATEVKGTTGIRQVVRALSADELVSLSMTPSGDDWKVTLRRLSASDSAVRWVGDFSVARDAALMFNDAVRARLRQAYPDAKLRSGEKPGSISPEDYETFLQLERRVRRSFANDVPHTEMLASLERLRRRAPDYLEVHLLQSNWAHYQAETNHLPEDVTLALEAADRARKLAPDDPRPLLARYSALSLQSDWAKAEAVLQELRQLVPGDPNVDLLEARLLESRGDRAAAIEKLERLVRRRPARLYIERLVRMQYNAGRYDDARTHLTALMRDYPDYVFPRSYLAQLELLYGAPAKAETLYTALVEQYPRATYFSNLGLAQMLLHRYAPSAQNFERAARETPDDAVVLVNLADAKWLLGEKAEAESLYRRILTSMRTRADSADWSVRLMAAQCQAHLGMKEQSVATAMDVLRTEGENAEVAFLASLVNALSGETSSAIVLARRAVELGMQPRWFDLPWFDALRTDARFQQALRAGPTAGGPS